MSQQSRILDPMNIDLSDPAQKFSRSKTFYYVLQFKENQIFIYILLIQRIFISKRCSFPFNRYLTFVNVFYLQFDIKEIQFIPFFSKNMFYIDQRCTISKNFYAKNTLFQNKDSCQSTCVLQFKENQIFPYILLTLSLQQKNNLL